MWSALVALSKSFLDTILPRKERTLRIERYTLADLVISPSQHEACGRSITTLLEYQTPAVRDLIKALKYDRTKSAASLLGASVTEYLREEIAQIRLFSSLPITLIPVPLHASRRRERGFNQIENVLEHMPNDFKDGTQSLLDTTSLVRIRATPQQTRLSREERLYNVAGAFTLTRPIVGHVILIDDVTTTGATLVHAAAPLQGAASVQLFALARA